MRDRPTAIIITVVAGAVAVGAIGCAGVIGYYWYETVIRGSEGPIRHLRWVTGGPFAAFALVLVGYFAATLALARDPRRGKARKADS